MPHPQNIECKYYKEIKGRSNDILVICTCGLNN